MQMNDCCSEPDTGMNEFPKWGTEAGRAVIGILRTARLGFADFLADPFGLFADACGIVAAGTPD